MSAVARWVAIFALGSVAAACGGKVVVGVEGDSGGVGGSGAGSSTSVVSSSSASSSSSTIASSTSSGVACVDDGDCGACFDCANQGPCADLATACGNDPDCSAFADCTSTSDCQSLGPDECLAKCKSEHPQGGAELIALIQCSACGVCVNSCTVPFSFFCPTK